VPLLAQVVAMPGMPLRYREPLLPRLMPLELQEYRSSAPERQQRPSALTGLPESEAAPERLSLFDPWSKSSSRRLLALRWRRQRRSPRQQLPVLLRPALR
jgi:hypothetical protein